MAGEFCSKDSLALSGLPELLTITASLPLALFCWIEWMNENISTRVKVNNWTVTYISWKRETPLTFIYLFVRLCVYLFIYYFFCVFSFNWLQFGWACLFFLFFVLFFVILFYFLGLGELMFYWLLFWERTNLSGLRGEKIWKIWGEGKNIFKNYLKEQKYF